MAGGGFFEGPRLRRFLPHKNTHPRPRPCRHGTSHAPGGNLPPRRPKARPRFCAASWPKAATSCALARGSLKTPRRAPRTPTARAVLVRNGFRTKFCLFPMRRRALGTLVGLRRVGLRAGSDQVFEQPLTFCLFWQSFPFFQRFSSGSRSLRCFGGAFFCFPKAGFGPGWCQNVRKKSFSEHFFHFLSFAQKPKRPQRENLGVVRFSFHAQAFLTSKKQHF